MLNLQAELEAVKQQRMAQRRLTEDKEYRLEVAYAIFDAIEPDVRLAMLPTVFRWEYDENGGLLVVLCYRDLPIIGSVYHLRQFLEAVRKQAGVTRVVFVCGDRQVRCGWDEDGWHVHSRRRVS
jgi:hypothetical protein